MILLPGGLAMFGKPSGVANVYFDPSNKGARFTLSNGNATAANSGSPWNCVRSITSHSTGKRYAEINLDVTDGSGFSMFGVGNSSVALTNYCGADTNGWSLRFTGTTPCTFHNATAGSDLGTGISAGQRAMLFCDWDTSPGNVMIWFGMNGTWVAGGDPSAGTGAQFTVSAATFYLFLSSFGALTYTLKNNVGENAHTIPTGGSMWG